VPELLGLQAAVLQSQVKGNVPCLNAEVDKMGPADVVRLIVPLSFARQVPRLSSCLLFLL
jgi:hypothetical protein